MAVLFANIMHMKFLFALLAVAVLLVTGCQSPKLGYKAPPASPNPTGPSVAVLPLVDASLL
jgi:uncharacterized lipoprotein YajG